MNCMFFMFLEGSHEQVRDVFSVTTGCITYMVVS